MHTRVHAHSHPPRREAPRPHRHLGRGSRKDKLTRGSLRKVAWPTAGVGRPYHSPAPLYRLALPPAIPTRLLFNNLSLLNYLLAFTTLTRLPL